MHNRHARSCRARYQVGGPFCRATMCHLSLHWASCMVGMSGAVEYGYQVGGAFCLATMRRLKFHWASCMIDMREAAARGYQVRGPFCRATMRTMRRLSLYWALCMVDMSEAFECGYQARDAFCRAAMRRLNSHVAATEIRPQFNASRPATGPRQGNTRTRTHARANAHTPCIAPCKPTPYFVSPRTVQTVEGNMFAPPGRRDTRRREPELPAPDLNIESERALKSYVYFADRPQAMQQLSILRSGAGGFSCRSAGFAVRPERCKHVSFNCRR